LTRGTALRFSTIKVYCGASPRLMPKSGTQLVSLKHDKITRRC